MKESLETYDVRMGTRLSWLKIGLVVRSLGLEYEPSGSLNADNFLAD
jgi:hypothetical protein